jgi:hypothetical protein
MIPETLFLDRWSGTVYDPTPTKPRWCGGTIHATSQTSKTRTLLDKVVFAHKVNKLARLPIQTLMVLADGHLGSHASVAEKCVVPYSILVHCTVDVTKHARRSTMSWWVPCAQMCYSTCSPWW